MRPNVDSNDLGFGHRLGLAAKADAIRGEGVRPKCWPHAAAIQAAPMLFRRFQEKRRGAGRQDASTQNLERRFDSIETEMASGKMVEQVKVRQQMHGEIAAKRGVTVAAVTADAGDLDRALIELDVVALMSFGR